MDILKKVLRFVGFWIFVGFFTFAVWLYISVMFILFD